MPAMLLYHSAHATSTGCSNSRIPRLRSESNPNALVWVTNCEMFPREHDDKERGNNPSD